MVMCVTSNWPLPQQLSMIYIHHERISRTAFVRKETLGITTGACVCVLFSNTHTHNSAITTTTEKQQQKVGRRRLRISGVRVALTPHPKNIKNCTEILKHTITFECVENQTRLRKKKEILSIFSIRQVKILAKAILIGLKTFSLDPIDETRQIPMKILKQKKRYYV